MGGIGSGRPWEGRPTVDAFRRRLEVDQLRRNGVIQPGDRGLHFGAGDIALEWRSCRFSGERPFFLCPRCRRNVLHLYLASGAIRCRTCFRLRYQSQCEPLHQRRLRRADKIAKRLGYDGGDWIPKPTRMRWATFNRLADEMEACEAAGSVKWAAHILAKFGERS